MQTAPKIVSAVGFSLREDTAKNHNNHKDVEYEAEHDAEHRHDSDFGAEEDGVFHHGGNSEQQRNEDQALPKAYRVNSSPK